MVVYVRDVYSRLAGRFDMHCPVHMPSGRIGKTGADGGTISLRIELERITIVTSVAAGMVEPAELCVCSRALHCKALELRLL